MTVLPDLSKSTFRRSVGEASQGGGVVFQYSQPAPTAYTLVLDQSNSTGQHRWRLLRQQLHRWDSQTFRTSSNRLVFRFIQLVPDGSQLSVVTMTSSARVVVPPTTVTQTNRAGLHGRIPRRVVQARLVAYPSKLRSSTVCCAEAAPAWTAPWPGRGSWPADRWGLYCTTL